MLQSLDNEIDDVDAKIGDNLRLLDRSKIMFCYHDITFRF